MCSTAQCRRSGSDSYPNSILGFAARILVCIDDFLVWKEKGLWTIHSPNIKTNRIVLPSTTGWTERSSRSIDRWYQVLNQLIDASIYPWSQSSGNDLFGSRDNGWRLGDVLSKDVSSNEPRKPHSEFVMDKCFCWNRKDLCKNVRRPPWLSLEVLLTI